MITVIPMGWRWSPQQSTRKSHMPRSFKSFGCDDNKHLHAVNTTLQCIFNTDIYIYIAIFVYTALYLAIYLIYNISIFKAGSIELTYSILAIKSNQAANWVMCATKSTWRLWGCLALSPPWHWLKRKHQVAVTNCRAKLVLIILFRYFSVSSHRGPQIWNPSWCSVFVKRSSLFSSVRF
jgi:hypothetical protein